MKATVSSRLKYGLHICVNAAATAIDKIQLVQNEALCIVTSAAKPTACDALHFCGRQTSYISSESFPKCHDNTIAPLV